MDMKDALLDIVAAISRKKGTFAITKDPTDDQRFVLSTGHHRVVSVPGGAIVTLVLSREQVTTLRDNCNQLLGME